MERKGPNIGLIMMIIIIFIMIFSDVIFYSPIISIFGIVIILIVVTFLSTRHRTLKTSYNMASEVPSFEKIPFRFNFFRFRRWILIPIGLIILIGFILFKNWWLTINITETMYLNKANINWWNLTFLDNNYFYACLGIGLIVALSDPRIKIMKDSEGKRKIYFHSKFWELVNLVRGIGQIYYGNTVKFLRSSDNHDDLISFKKGIVWKIAEFIFGSIFIGPVVAKNLALGYMIISKWAQTNQITLSELLNKTLSVLYNRLFSFEIISGSWLIENSPILEFLTWLRIPIFILGVIWGIRLFISLFSGLRKGELFSSFRSVTLIVFIFISILIMQVPSWVFDVTTPYYARTLFFGWIIVLSLSIIFSIGHRKGMIFSSIFKNRIVLAIIVIITSSALLYGPVVVAINYAPAMQGHWEDWVWQPKYLPVVEYTQWSAGLQSVKEDDITSIIETGNNIELLKKVRVYNDEASKLRLRPSIGVNWMDFQTVHPADIVFLNEKEYWVSALTIVLPPVAGSEDRWRAMRLLVTHSEKILAIDAASGEFVPMEQIFNTSKTPLIYYGEGGLFSESDIIYTGIPGINENHLPEYTGPISYQGEPDYVLSGFDRLWFFSGIYGIEGARWDFARGDYGDVKMLYKRDITKRISSLLLPGMVADADPYIVSDGQKLYYAVYIYIERDMPTQYLDFPTHQDKFWRLFAITLVDVYDGRIQGYFMSLNENNYVLDFYRSMYPQWKISIPSWLEKQMRYPEYLLEKQIDANNIYHVSDPDKWQKSTDFFELTSDSSRKIIEDVRYVVFSLQNKTRWLATRLVEWYQSPGKNLAGMYAAYNEGTIGSILFLRSGTVPVIGPQVAIDTINNFNPTKSLLTLHANWVHGNILMYDVKGTLYYFIPYYAQETGTMSPAMISIVDAISQRVGYYVIQNPQDSVEVGLASEKAYINLVGITPESGSETRRLNILNLFNNYTLKVPEELHPDVVFREDTITYYSDVTWNQTSTAIKLFIDDWVKNKVTQILVWNIDEKSINIGSLIDNQGIVELHYINVQYIR